MSVEDLKAVLSEQGGINFGLDEKALIFILERIKASRFDERIVIYRFPGPSLNRAGSWRVA